LRRSEAKELVPFFIGRGAVFLAGARCTAAGDERAVAGDDLLGVDGLVMWLRSRRLPVSGSSAEVLPAVAWLVIERRSVWPAAVNNAPGALAWAVCNRWAAVCMAPVTASTRMG
jgi:hypothetical protein